MSTNNQELYKNLILVGLLEKEAAVYLALLELGKRTVSPIARKAGINRTSVYDILDRLVNKGLVSVSGKEPTQEYVAESPNKLENLIEKEILQKQEELKIIKNLVPQLKSIHNVSARPKIKFYEGTEGLEQVYEDTLTSSETILGYANVKEMHDALPDYFPKYYKRRTNKGINIRAILPSNQAGLERVNKDKDEARDSVLIPADKVYFIPEIDIYDNKVMIASWREKLGIIIESQEIADAMKQIYELAWIGAKQVAKENGK